MSCNTCRWEVSWTTVDWPQECSPCFPLWFFQSISILPPVFFWKLQPSHVASLLKTLISIIVALKLKSESSTCPYKALNDLTFYFFSFISHHPLLTRPLPESFLPMSFLKSSCASFKLSFIKEVIVCLSHLSKAPSKAILSKSIFQFSFRFLTAVCKYTLVSLIVFLMSAFPIRLYVPWGIFCSLWYLYMWHKA